MNVSLRRPRWLPVLVGCSLVTAGAAEVPQDSVTIRVALARPGTSFDVSLEEVTEIRYRLGRDDRWSQQFSQRSDVATRRVDSVLAPEQPHVTHRLEIEYQSHLDRADGSRDPQPLPTHGKTYEVRVFLEEEVPGEENEPGRDPSEAWEVAGLDGRSDAEEYGAVLADAVDLLRPNPISEYLRDHPPKKDQPIQIPDTVAQAAISRGDEQLEVRAFQLTLREVAPRGGVECALFDATYQLRLPASDDVPFEMTGDVEATLAIATEFGWLMEFRTQGAFTASTRDLELAVEVEGELRGSLTFSLRE